MGSDILSIGRSGLFAAQVGLSTTGHNIANANVPGYSRQRIVQTASQALDFGYGFTGTGTQIDSIQRYSNSFLAGQVNSAQATKSSLDAFLSQVSQIDNLLADTTSGLSPALQDFFKGVQDVSSNPASPASRQALLSAADSLAARFQGINGRIDEIRAGVNDRIEANVTLINSYASQIASLNDQISAFANNRNNTPNDLLDQRDALITELNKHIKATVTPGDNNSYTVSVGTGQPVVVGSKSYELATTPSATDPLRTEVGFRTGKVVTVMDERVLAGGELGGLFEFRTSTLDPAQNSLGRVALSLAYTFNAQHRLGQDQSGEMGGDFFNASSALVGKNANNSPIATTQVTATLSDPSQLTTSDYKLQFDGVNWSVTRLDDNKTTLISPFPQPKPQTIDGLDFAVSGSGVTGDNFLIRPTINGAAEFKVVLNDRNKIAAAAPVSTGTVLGNSGTAKISEGTIDKTYLNAGNKLTSASTIGYDKATDTLSGFPVGKQVTVTQNGVSTNYPANTPVPYVEDATYSVGGISFSFTGKPADGDSFTIGPNTNGVGDNRNMRILGTLQTRNILDSGTATLQGAYAQMVSFVGNKTREVDVNSQAAGSLLEQSTKSQQDVVGVNLDEEATQLLKYQQAYQAAGKVIKLAADLFQTLLSVGA
ncbi:flagellar hook-associated protein FlgK [Massilia sp. TS11]|uniref:flagellar hook-associated protein FlgK n=1 Tax=Massilia sp. TS11 TaxID=2908003 RepID=UPI001EDC057E|nr:flagellar hook-associated protein FlgK [Massilia sp. TS11]MCG2582864.1 flagellar hook-associated protein FlgK [Massilia sp. TS11]